MKRSVLLLIGVAFFWSISLPTPRCRAAAPAKTFTITIDRAMWEKWGFQYPVTYVFRVSAVGADAKVERHDDPPGAWSLLAVRRGDQRFDGVEGVRWDAAQGRACVSVGFRTANRIELRFSGVGSAAYDSPARYYDNRKAAYTLSDDNWGRQASAHPGAAWQGATDDASDKYQAAVHVCRGLHLPVSIAVNSRIAGGAAMWQRMQEELDYDDFSWEPAVHTQTHPSTAAAYKVRGYQTEILGCRDDILVHLRKIPYGQHVFEYILPSGHYDGDLAAGAAGEFLFLRPWNGHDNPASSEYAAWNATHRYYDQAGFETRSYDRVMEKRRPKGRYYAADVALLNAAFDSVRDKGGIFYAMWHSDRYQNSVIHDPRPGVDGIAGSTLIQHLSYVAGQKDIWHVANGWLYSYRYAAENARVVEGGR